MIPPKMCPVCNNKSKSFKTLKIRDSFRAICERCGYKHEVEKKLPEVTNAE